MTVKHVVQATPVIEYDGSNGQEILDALGPAAVAEFAVTVTESGGEATVEWTGYDNITATFTLAAGDWVRVSGIGSNWGVFSTPEDRGMWVEVPTP